MRVGPFDRLDRIRADKDDLEIVTPFVLTLESSVGDCRLVAINELLLAEQTLGAKVIDKKEMLQGHMDRLPIGGKVVVDAALETGENMHEVGIWLLPPLIGGYGPSN